MGGARDVGFVEKERGAPMIKKLLIMLGLKAGLARFKKWDFITI